MVRTSLYTLAYKNRFTQLRNINHCSSQKRVPISADTLFLQPINKKDMDKPPESMQEFLLIL